MSERPMSLLDRRRRALALAAAVAASLAPAAARAEGDAAGGPGDAPGAADQTPAPAPPAPAATPDAARAADWRARYEKARARMVDGDYRAAEVELSALAADAPSESDRVLAAEVASVAKATADRLDAATKTLVTPRAPAVRSSDELSLLYATSALYGAGTGVWFLLLAQPDSALTATLPFAAITAAPIIAVATVDGAKKLRPGVPHSVSAGVYLGLGEGMWLVGYQQSRAARLESESPGTGARWRPEGVASVLWAGATLGGVVGGVLGSSLVTTPGRVSFTASTTLWSGVITGLAAGALQSDGPARSERAFAIGGIGYNAGLAFGMLGASAVSPSVARVRIVDLLGVAGGLSTLGGYLASVGEPNRRAAEGLAALGAGAGVALGWIVTAGMAADRPTEAPKAGVVLSPSIVPVPGGASLGVVGAL